MIGGKFENSDIPGLVPSQDQVRRMAVDMGRAMFPEKFAGYVDVPVKEPEVTLSPEEFDKRTAELETMLRPQPERKQPEQLFYDTGEKPLSVQQKPPAESPLSRLFAAVRKVINHEHSSPIGFSFGEAVAELDAAYSGLNLDD